MALKPFGGREDGQAKRQQLPRRLDGPSTAFGRIGAALLDDVQVHFVAHHLVLDGVAQQCMQLGGKVGRRATGSACSILAGRCCSSSTLAHEQLHGRKRLRKLGGKHLGVHRSNHARLCTPRSCDRDRGVERLILVPQHPCRQQPHPALLLLCAPVLWFLQPVELVHLEPRRSALDPQVSPLHHHPHRAGVIRALLGTLELLRQEVFVVAVHKHPKLVQRVCLDVELVSSLHHGVDLRFNALRDCPRALASQEDHLLQRVSALVHQIALVRPAQELRLVRLQQGSFEFRNVPRVFCRFKQSIRSFQVRQQPDALVVPGVVLHVPGRLARLDRFPHQMLPWRGGQRLFKRLLCLFQPFQHLRRFFHQRPFVAKVVAHLERLLEELLVHLLHCKRERVVGVYNLLEQLAAFAHNLNDVALAVAHLYQLLKLAPVHLSLGDREPFFHLLRDPLFDKLFEQLPPLFSHGSLDPEQVGFAHGRGKLHDVRLLVCLRHARDIDCAQAFELFQDPFVLCHDRPIELELAVLQRTVQHPRPPELAVLVAQLHLFQNRFALPLRIQPVCELFGTNLDVPFCKLLVRQSKRVPLLPNRHGFKHPAVRQLLVAVLCDERERCFLFVGFDATDVVRISLVQLRHQRVQLLFELLPERRLPVQR